MSEDVEFVSPDASVQEAAVLMGEIDVGGLPVGTPERALGVVTVRDLLYRVCAAGLDPASTPVRQVMSREVFTCSAEDDLSAAMDVMAAHHVRRLIVSDADGGMVGWITLSDIARRLLIDSPLVREGLDELNRAIP
jgi:CBS domain-containing protein